MPYGHCMCMAWYSIMSVQLVRWCKKSWLGLTKSVTLVTQRKYLPSDYPDRREGSNGSDSFSGSPPHLTVGARYSHDYKPETHLRCSLFLSLLGATTLTAVHSVFIEANNAQLSPKKILLISYTLFVTAPSVTMLRKVERNWIRILKKS